ncbi:MAG: hypothetical protein HYU66_22295 [Armatimonadetes bacterium]|nr:hypothetical protein [Armatimonadota bacterium]
MPFEEEYLDVLMAIEMAIQQVYVARPDLVDEEVHEALEALVKSYLAESRRREARVPPLSRRAALVYADVRGICEWRLGRADSSGTPTAGVPLNTLNELLLCLKRIRKSIRLWTAEGGPRGYLEFVRQNTR